MTILNHPEPTVLDTGTSARGRRVFWAWSLCSGLGIALGAFLAVLIVPQAGFEQNPVGEYGPHLLAFASIIGLTLGAAQYIVLHRIMTDRDHAIRSWLPIWIPVTAIGIVAMIWPLWGFPAMMLVWEPWLAAFIMLPGILILGVGQWWLMRSLALSGPIWILKTSIGGLTGATFGLMAAMMVSVSVELVWGGLTGFCIGLCQADSLAKTFGEKGSPRFLLILGVALGILLAIAYFGYLWMEML